MTVRVDQYFSTLFGMQTHFQNTQYVRGPPDLYAVAHRLRTADLEHKIFAENFMASSTLFKLAMSKQKNAMCVMTTPKICVQV